MVGDTSSSDGEEAENKTRSWSNSPWVQQPDVYYNNQASFPSTSTSEGDRSGDSSVSLDEKPQEATSEAEWKPDRSVWLILAALSTILFVAALDATILVSSLPTIADALNAGSTEAFWIGTSYLLASATLQPLVSSLADLFGRRWLLFLSVFWFTVGTVICCVAPNILTLLAGRSVQGIGGGGILAMNLIILADIIPLRERAKFTGYVQLVFAIGTILGPVVGGLFADNTSWRWIFYINLPFCAIGLAAVPFVVRYDINNNAPLLEKLRSIDWVGATMFIVFLTSFLVGISWGGSQFPWLSAATLVPLCTGAVGVVATIFWEKFFAYRPFIRLQVFNNISANACFACTIIQAFLLYASLYYAAFWLHVVKDRSPTATGVGLLPISCLMVPTSALAGAIITRVGRYRWAIWSGWVITVTANGLLIILDEQTSTPVWATVLLVVGLGQGLLLISLNLAIQAIASNTNPANVPSAAAMYSFMRSLGLCLGVAIGGTIFTNFFSTRLAYNNLPTIVAQNAEGFVATLDKMPDSVPAQLTGSQAQQVAQQVQEKNLFLESYEWGFQHLFIVLTGIAALGLMISFLVKSFSLIDKVDNGPRGQSSAIGEQQGAIQRGGIRRGGGGSLRRSGTYLV